MTIWMTLMLTACTEVEETEEARYQPTHVTKEDYVHAYFEVTCDLTYACHPAEDVEAYGYGETAEDCTDFFVRAWDEAQEEGEPDDCVYQAKEGDACIAGLEAIECDDYVAGDFPVACSNVCE